MATNGDTSDENFAGGVFIVTQVSKPPTKFAISPADSEKVLKSFQHLGSSIQALESILLAPDRLASSSGLDKRQERMLRRIFRQLGA
jgi:hypothetical protein